MIDETTGVEVKKQANQNPLMISPIVNDDAGFGLVPDPALVNPMTNAPTQEAIQQHEADVEKQRQNEYWLMDESVTGSSLHESAMRLGAYFGNTPDPHFNAVRDMPQLFTDIAPMYHEEIANTTSRGEATDVYLQIKKTTDAQSKLAASGYAGMAANMAAMFMDADAILIPLTGGSYLGEKTAMKLATMGMKDGRIASTLVGAAGGLEAGAVVGAATAYSPTGNSGDIAATVLGGMAMGGTLGGAIGQGAITPEHQLEAAMRAHDAYAAARATNFKPVVSKDSFFKPAPAQKAPVAASSDMPNAADAVSVAGESVGAGRVRFVQPPPGMRESSIPWFNRAADDGNAENARKVLTGQMDAETTNVDQFIGRAAQQVQNWVDKSPLKSLYTSISDMGVVGNKLAYDLLYHPGGMMDGAAHPAAGLNELYRQELSVPLQNFRNLAATYHQRANQTFTDKARNMFMRQSEYDEFSRAVRWELESRYHDGRGDPNVDNSVKQMADMIDTMHEQAVRIMQGRPGEVPVNGAENLQFRTGYYSRKWAGSAMGNIPEESIVNALTKGYLRLLPAGAVVDMETVKSMVKSIVTRSKAMEEGIDTNLVGLLRDNGKEFLRDTLKNNKLSDEQIQSLIDAFTGSAAERSKPGFLKGRIELDMRTPIDGTDKTLLDLLEPDMYKSLHQYSRKTAGTSALARKGYQLGDRTSIIESIKDEMVANGYDVKDPRIDDMLNTAFSYFGAGAIGQGVDPLVLSAMRLTRQSLLGSLGLVQLSELGDVISMVGVDAAIKSFPAELRAMFNGKTTPLMQELHDAFMFMDKDAVLHDPQLALDVLGKSSIIQSEFMDAAHKGIAFGDKIAGYTSLFFQAMTFSQRLALSGVNHKIYSVLTKEALNAGAYRRLLDLGLDETMATKLQDYITKGHIKYDADGNLTMGFDKWNPKDLEEYKLAMNQFVSRAVQRSLPGENPYWATKQFGQIVGQLRMFPLQALQKQFLRQMRHADIYSASAMVWNLGIAGLVYSTNETIKGRGDKLTPERIAKGALNYAPTTGWLPMMTDPIAEITGFDALKMNQYGPPGRATDGIIPVPPVIPTMNRIMHIPGAVFHTLTGDMDKQDISALSSIPIVGSAYGFSAGFNQLRDHADRNNQREAHPATPAAATPAAPEEAARQTPSAPAVSAPAPKRKTPDATPPALKESLPTKKKSSKQAPTVESITGKSQ